MQECYGPVIKQVETVKTVIDKEKAIMEYRGMVKNTEVAYYQEDEERALITFYWGDGWESRLWVPNHLDTPTEGILTRVRFQMKEVKKDIEDLSSKKGSRTITVAQRHVLEIEPLPLPAGTEANGICEFC